LVRLFLGFSVLTAADLEALARIILLLIRFWFAFDPVLVRFWFDPDC
jgi:hypothetical protein